MAVAEAQERKVVTVVFVDLVGSTKLAAGLDPERFREVLAAFYDTVSNELAALRGRAENFIGDAVLGVFGLPTARDDDALRAISAALSIVERVDEGSVGGDRLDETGRGAGSPAQLRVRIGINTGPVAVGPAADRGLLLGTEVNLAARLQQAAEPGEILVGETTWRLARSQVEFGPRKKVQAKGFEEVVPAWPVIRLSPPAARRSIRLVDRRRELDLLGGTFERALERSRAHMVTLVGEPGIGKSRVVEEFLASLPDTTTVLLGRVSAFEEDATFGPVAQMVLQELGVEEDAPRARVRERLEEVVAGCCDPGEAEQVVARLGLALGIGDSGEDGRYRTGEIRAGLLALLRGIARERSIVLVFEDLHLAQAALLEVIEQLVKDARKLPLMVLCVGRWELLEEHPSWGGGLADASTLWIEPLDHAHATELALEAAEGLKEQDAERIARHTGGNPFFIVETTAMLKWSDEGVPRPGARPGSLLPPTVQAVVAARIDNLPPTARDLIRKASVFARARFGLSELALIADPSEELLDVLEDEEMLVRDEERPELWRFRHDLLRDVAYESLTKRERQRLHLRMANKLSEPGSAERYPRAIAYHLEQAARAALDLSPNDRELADRAVDALARAGDLARRGIESRTAVDLYERALALAGPEHAWGEREAWILSALGESRYWLGEFEAAESDLTRASELGAGNVKVQAHASRFLADLNLTIRAEPERAAELFERSLAASRELGDPVTLARTLLMAGWVPFWSNDLEPARLMFQEALEVARSGSRADPWAEARALVGLASCISPVGDEEEAYAMSLAALELGRTSKDAFTTAVAEERVGASLRRMMHLVEAREHFEAAIKTYRQLDARWELASVLGDLGVVQRLTGELEAAEASLRWAYRLCRDLKERALVTWTAAELARILVAKGEVQAARQILEEPSARLAAREPGSLTALLTAETIVTLAEGERGRALATAVTALEAEREQGLPNPLAAQTWFTGRVFGDDAAGGEDEMRNARATLEAAHWMQALREPDLVGRAG
jgi:class 3 adenylate cyclase/tetratricopeptide (TPR) repeat protein